MFESLQVKSTVPLAEQLRTQADHFGRDVKRRELLLILHLFTHAINCLFQGPNQTKDESALIQGKLS